MATGKTRRSKILRRFLLSRERLLALYELSFEGAEEEEDDRTEEELTDLGVDMLLIFRSKNIHDAVAAIRWWVEDANGYASPEDLDWLEAGVKRARMLQRTMYPLLDLGIKTPLPRRGWEFAKKRTGRGPNGKDSAEVGA